MAIKRLTCVVALAALSGLAAGPAAAESCVELQLRGKEVFDIPCPEGLDEVLEALTMRPREDKKRDFSITPEVPDDREMEIVPAWPPKQAPAGEPEAI